MITVKNINRLGILLALLLIFWGVSPFVTNTLITNDILATSIILILIGVGYIIAIFKPQWLKAILFFEGLVIGVSGWMLLNVPYNYLFLVIGLVILLIAILAYIQKLPNSILRFFYR